MPELIEMDLDRVDLCGSPKNPECHVTLFKAHPDVSSERQNPGGPMPTPEEKIAALSKEIEDMRKAQEAKDAEIAKATDEAEKAKAKADAETAKAIEAAKPLAEQLDALAKANEATQAELAKAQDALAKAEAERKDAHYLSLAKADYEPLGAADEIGPMLKSIADTVPAETQATLERVLKAASAQLSSAEHMRQVSKGMPNGTANAGMEKITKAASALVETGVCKTIEIAKAKVAKEHPEWVAEYRESLNA